MEQQQLEILGRFDESRNAYNTASGLLKKGNSAEAEKLLRKALALYPREVMMDESTNVDPTVRESFDLLFSNIRMRLEQIEREKNMPPPITSGAVSSLQEIVERNMGLKSGVRSAPVIFGADSSSAAGASSSLSDVSNAAALSPQVPVTIPTIEEVLSMGDEPEVAAALESAPETADEAQSAELISEGKPRAPKYAYEPPEPVDESVEPPAAVAPEVDSTESFTVDTDESEQAVHETLVAEVAVAAVAPPVVEEPADVLVESPSPETVHEDTPAAVQNDSSAGQAVSEEVPPLHEPEITEDVFGAEKKKRKGFSMKLPGLLKRKEKPVKDDNVVEGAAPEKPVDAPDSEPVAAETEAPTVEQSEVIKNDADVIAPATVEEKAGKPDKKAKKPKKEKAVRQRATKAPPKKKAFAKARAKKAVDVSALAASVIFALLIGAGAAAAFIGVKPMMSLQRAFVNSLNIENPKAGKPALDEKVMDGLLSTSGGRDALSALSFLASVSAPDEQGKGLLLSVVSSDVSKLSLLKKSDDAMRISGWAQAGGFASPFLAEKKYTALRAATVRLLKAGNPEEANKYFDQLSKVMSDENFPDPGSHYLRVVNTAKVANFLFLALAEKRLDNGDPEGAYWALDRIRASRAEVAEKHGALSARTSGSLAAKAVNARQSDPENAARWERMSRSIID